jgi:NADPH-dependent ferric siderophore reductase
MSITLDDVRWSSVEGPVLLAGDSQSVPEMQRIASQLPAGVPATMLVEAFSPMQVHHVEVPAHVAVCWLVRDTGGGEGPAHSRGQRLATAVHAWCAEWACLSGPDTPDCIVWLAARTPPRVVRMARAMLDAMHADAGR